jgi:nitroimidazol reductase NimA-like FMN-containing flavoprotein (pyridoxamine 5'-phosphate oxidase superfamily)
MRFSAKWLLILTTGSSRIPCGGAGPAATTASRTRGRTHDRPAAAEAMRPTERSHLRRMPKRGSHKPEVIRAILDAGFLAHVGFQVDGQPFVIPTLYGREEDNLYLHGSAISRLLGELKTGIAACVTVTLVDGLVLARSAFNHSMNYRSVVAFGTAREIDEPEQKTKALRIISEHILAGRWNDVRDPTKKELNATAVLAFAIDEASAKIRQGPPIDDEDDYGMRVWAGIVPLRLEAQAPIPDPRLSEGIATPSYVSALARKDAAE